MHLNLVSPRQGTQWVKLGIRTFFRQPLALSGLFFMFLALMTVLSQVPFIGIPLAMTLMPAITLGLMVATREASEGRFPMPIVLLAAFRAGQPQSRAMLGLGLMYCLGFMGAMGVSWLVDGGGFARVYMGGATPSPELMLTPGFQGAMWSFIGLYLPLSLLFWHAPALVHWHGVTPVKSLFFSVVACLRNVGAMTMFALSWLGVLMLLVLAMSTLLALLGLQSVAAAILYPMLLTVACMFFTSLYFSFRDTFDPQ